MGTNNDQIRTEAYMPSFWRCSGTHYGLGWLMDYFGKPWFREVMGKLAGEVHVRVLKDRYCRTRFPTHEQAKQAIERVQSAKVASTSWVFQEEHKHGHMDRHGVLRVEFEKGWHLFFTSTDSYFPGRGDE